MLIIFSVQTPKQVSPLLTESLELILSVCRSHQQKRLEIEPKAESSQHHDESETAAPEDKGEVTQELDSKQTIQQEREDDSDTNADSNVDVCMEDNPSDEVVKDKPSDEVASTSSNDRELTVDEETGRSGFGFYSSTELKNKNQTE